MEILEASEFKKYFPKGVKVVLVNWATFKVFSKKEIEWPSVPGYSIVGDDAISFKKDGKVDSYSVSYFYTDD